MCEHDWCVTPHGTTTHPADDDHRSPGRALPAVTRAPGERHDGTDVELEVGLLRRQSDESTWLVIESGAGWGIEIALDSARRIVRAIAHDDTLRRALEG